MAARKGSEGEDPPSHQEQLKSLRTTPWKLIPGPADDDNSEEETSVLSGIEMMPRLSTIGTFAFRHRRGLDKHKTLPALHSVVEIGMNELTSSIVMWGTLLDDCLTICECYFHVIKIRITVACAMLSCHFK
jgi:hypothetical protein